MTIYVVLTLDIDNDGVSVSDERNRLSWNGIANIPKIGRLRETYNLKATWFVRADDQMEQVYGTAGYLLKEYRDLWQELANGGDEIAWHPHLYRYAGREKKYVIETNDVLRVRNLQHVYGQLKEEGFDFMSARIGEALHSNAMMRTLDSLGLKVDSTALPGRRRSDEERKFDWQPTPNKPYHPSVRDYRIPRASGSDRCLSILEVPMTTIPIKTDYDRDFLKRYVNLTFHHQLVKEGLDFYLNDLDELGRRGESESFLTLIIHPDEICEEAKIHPLYSFSMDEVRRNVEYLLGRCERDNIKVRFLRIKDVLGLVGVEN